MAIIDTIYIGQLQLLIVDTDPIISGVTAPLGSLILNNNGGGLYYKFNTGTTDVTSIITTQNASLITQTLSQTLINGNTMGSNDIIMPDTQFIKSSNSYSKLELNTTYSKLYGGVNYIQIDNSVTAIYYISGTDTGAFGITEGVSEIFNTNTVSLNAPTIYLPAQTPSRLLWLDSNNNLIPLTGTGVVKLTSDVVSLDNSTYLTSNQTITLSGDVTGAGITAITASISNTTITSKILTGYVSGAGTVSATDTILQAIQKLNGNISGLGTLATLSSVNLSTLATGTLQAAQFPALNGDITTVAGNLTTTIGTNKVITSMLAQQATSTILGRVSAGTGNVEVLTATQVKTMLNIPTNGTFGITIDGAGSVISTGFKQYIIIPYNCIINEWYIIGDTIGSCVIDVWKNTTIPTVANTITGSEKPTLTSQQTNNDTNLTTWTTTVNSGDIIGFNVDSVTTLTKINLVIKVTKI